MASQMTPAQKLGYTEGDKFIVIDKDCPTAEPGSIVTLSIDDGTGSPFFTGGGRYEEAAITLNRLKKVEDGPPKPGDRVIYNKKWADCYSGRWQKTGVVDSYAGEDFHDGDRLLEIHFDDGITKNMFAHRFTKINNEKAENMELKLYDKVYLKKNARGFKKGDTFEYVGGANFSKTGHYGKSLVVYKDQRSEFFSKQQAEMQAKQPGFKVGDTVRVVKSEIDPGVPHIASQDCVGKVGVIDHISTSGRHPISIGGIFSEWAEWELEHVNVELPEHRRTFRLLKETPEVKAGALVQEACDDGDQEYVLMDGQEDMVKFDDLDEYDITVCFSRKTVEENPNWFEEIYKLEKEVKSVETSWHTKAEYTKLAS